MRFFYILRIVVILMAGLIVADQKAVAQTFGLGVTTSASSILVSNSLTYIISVTNLTGFLLADTQVTNTLPASVQFLSATNGQGSFTNYGSVMVFDLGQFIYPGIAQMSLTVVPTVAGSITNTVTVATTNLAIVPVFTNIVTTVTNVVLPQADLGVALTGFVQPTNIVNDLMTYGVTATNLGTNDATAVQLTNILPPGVILKSVLPANLPYSVVTNNLIFNLGALVSGSVTNVQFTVQPTNTGVLTFSASIGSASIVDSNPTNNLASTNIAVINYLSPPLFVVTNSGQTINVANGLEEQSILVSNNVGTDVLAVRVVLTNLTKQLFNAIGTNNGNPFVVLNTTLAAGQSVNLRLQFAPRGSFSLANSQLSAFAVPLLSLAPPAAASTTTSLNLSRIVPLTDGTILVEFPTIVGRTYTVVYYNGSVASSNAAIAPPSITASANRVQWIDYGPPTTTSAPTNSSARFYRVFQNP